MRIRSLLFLVILLALGGSASAQNSARMLSTPDAQTGTSYTFVAADTTRVVTFNNAGAVAVTLPNGATLGFGAGTMLSVANVGAGTVTITCSSCTTGTLNATGNGAAGNVAIKPVGASAYRYVDGNGSDSNDGLLLGTAYATPQKCLSVIAGLGGGTCDASTLYTYTYGNTQGTILVGQRSPSPPMTLKLPPYGTWTCNINASYSPPAGTQANCLEGFTNGYLSNTAGGIGVQFNLVASATANVVDVCGTDPAPSAGAGYVRWEAGIGCQALAGAVVSGAAVHIQALFDNSHVSDINGTGPATNLKDFWVHGICCGSTVERAGGNGNNIATDVPCTLGSGSDENSGANIGPLSCTHAGTGKNDVVIVQSATGGAGAKYHDIYTEWNLASDCATTVLAVTGSSGNSDTIDHLVLGADACNPGSTRYLADFASGTSVIAHNFQLGGISANGINDHNTGRGTVSPGASAVITDYSTESNCCSLTGYFSKPGFFGLTNQTGLQLFNTTTTCTTAATINTPCTTGAITLPVAYSDTNYRVSCTGLSPTQFPQIQTVTKSNTTFTITLNNLTAAAASYTSYDCTVGHN